MNNMLLENIEYQVEKTGLGVWRRYMYSTGARFAEFKSSKTIYGLPLLHYTYGICPQTGKRITAKGVVAVGRVAVGILAIGHASLGVIAVGQLGVGLLFGLGQAGLGLVAIGQIAVGFIFGAGQPATGIVAIGQLAIGKYVPAQVGFGEYVCSQKQIDPAAREFFRSLLSRFF